MFGSTQITATATNKEGTEIRNCEFQFETSGTAPTQPKPQVEEQKQSEKEKPSKNQSSLDQTKITQDQTNHFDDPSGEQFPDSSTFEQLNSDLG